VTAIIHDSAQDPHEYEATPRDALAIAEADLVVVNGGGYDEFMATLLEAAGLENATPEEFSEAVEEGTDAPALVVRAVIDLVTRSDIALLAYNEQTVGPQTEQVLAAAQDAGTPVVSFTELLPEGEDYLGWMAANLDAIEAALAG
jgi:zinc/manganese transport system substrate-binding protein